MPGTADNEPKSSLLTFFGLTYAITWIFFIAAVVLSHRDGTASLLQVIVLPGVFAPAFIAIGLTYRAQGSTGLNALLARLFRWEVGAGWFVFAAGYIAAIKLSVALLYRMGTGAWPRFGDTPWYVMAAAIVISTPVQAGEEIGWRGYALPRLAARFGLGPASVLLGVIWAAWHLPLFFVRGADTYGQSFFIYVLQVTALSVAMAWLYANTNGSLLLTMLMHAAVNNTLDIVPSAMPGAMNTFSFAASPVAWLTLAMLWLCAGYFLIRMPSLRDQFPPRPGPGGGTALGFTAK